MWHLLGESLSLSILIQVAPPDEDVNGIAINCEPPDCSLHFHMDTSDYARLGVYSTASAPGIIVAHGTVIHICSVYFFLKYGRR